MLAGPGGAATVGLVGHVAYQGLDAPEVEVLWAGAWCFGTLHEWRREGERWVGWVRFNVTPGENRIGTFDQDLIRRLVWAAPPAKRRIRSPRTYGAPVHDQVNPSAESSADA